MFKKYTCQCCRSIVKSIEEYENGVMLCSFCIGKLRMLDRMRQQRKDESFWNEYSFLTNMDNPNRLLIDYLDKRYAGYIEELKNGPRVNHKLEVENNTVQSVKVEHSTENRVKEHKVKEESPAKLAELIGPFDGEMVYSINGARGKNIEIYKDRCVITTKVTLGSIIASNATDGEKTIYYNDCTGIQFKKSGLTLGYLQLETASSGGGGNNLTSNFFHENSFTYNPSQIPDWKMTEVVNFVKQRISETKKQTNKPVIQENSNISIADELLKFKQLLDMGVITQEEFDDQKKRLLN